jgi:hypothetical protein
MEKYFIYFSGLATGAMFGFVYGAEWADRRIKAIVLKVSKIVFDRSEEK